MRPLAADGAEALAAVPTFAPDLILSDWNMSPMTGLELLTQVRAAARVADEQRSRGATPWQIFRKAKLPSALPYIFAGLNMIQASFTGFCPAAMIFKKLGFRSGAAFR